MCLSLISGIQATIVAHPAGSDINCYPPISDQLDEMGIDVIPNYDVDQLKLSPDLIVIGNVMTRDTEIIEYILNHGLTYTSGPEWLGKNILANRRVISVAGTHGHRRSVVATLRPAAG